MLSSDWRTRGGRLLRSSSCSVSILMRCRLFKYDVYVDIVHIITVYNLYDLSRWRLPGCNLIHHLSMYLTTNMSLIVTFVPTAYTAFSTSISSIMHFKIENVGVK